MTDQPVEPVCKSPQGCHRVVPCEPGCGAIRPPAEPAARHTVDTITSDALDALYEQLEATQQTELARQLDTCDKAFASATLRAARAEARAERAEAAIERVRDLADETDAYGYSSGWVLTVSNVRAALDPQEQQT